MNRKAVGYEFDGGFEEYVLIPELQEQIRRISMKLEENERGNLVRLMKVKELVLAEARTQRFGGQ